MLALRLRSQALPLVRRFCAVPQAAVETPPKLSRFRAATRWLFKSKVMVPMPLVLGGAYSCNHFMQTHLGSSDDFFKGSFVTNKDPEAIAEFYQAEDLLKIIAVIPFFFSIVMDKVVPDEKEATEETALLSVGETHFNVSLVGMEVSFEIIEQEEETEDGESKLVSFNRHERFIDWMPLLADYGIKLLLWDQTWTFGFKTLEDGKVEVFHHGESFLGPWPIRLIVMIHQSYVLWACEKYINGDAFGTDDIDEQQDEMANIPLWKVKQFLATLRKEKERLLEDQKNEPRQNLDLIAETQMTIIKLKKLEEKDQPLMAMEKAPMVVPFGGKQMKAKLVVKDQDMSDILTDARQDAKGNRAVNAAMKDLTEEKGLAWKPTQHMKKTLSKPKA